MTSPGAVAGAGACGKVVLVVEDEALIRMTLADCLADAGYMVVEAGSADAAVVILSRGEQVDAVITDIRMPGSLDGIGLAAWMWKFQAGTPVMVASGFVSPHAAKAANPNALVISKPYAPSDIIGMLADVFA